MAFNYLGHRAISENPYHVEVVRRDLTRNLVTLFPEIHDEISEAFKGSALQLSLAFILKS
jgi:hypothetical protein